MVVIDRQRCTGCGLCVRICHEHCMLLRDGTVSIDSGVCSTCGQCVAVCPRTALSWDGAPPLPFEPECLPSPEQLEELFRERRTVRDFTDEKLDRATLQGIAAAGVYAPTHNFRLRCIVVDDPGIIDAFGPRARLASPAS